MPNTPAHDAESARLNALRSYGDLETGPEAVFDDLAALAARLCGVTMAAISFVDRDRQWFKSQYGFHGLESSRAQAILERDLLIVPDTSNDKRFTDDLFRTGDAPVRFYAGAPIMGSEGLPLGMICVMDQAPRPQGLNEDQRLSLEALARQVTALLELRRDVQRERTALKESVHRMRNVITVVQGVTLRTLAGASDLGSASETLMGRLDALGAAQDMLFAEGSAGADLKELLKRLLAPFVDPGDQRISLQGPSATLNANAAEALSMAVHELATNATKHGALSNDQGEITVVWSRTDGGDLTIEWSERRGTDAPISSERRQGFGSAVLGPLTAERIGGDARLELRSEGAHWSATIDRRSVLESSADS
ncbi:MAG: HWE histidine kinase domain-containing protein [Pseudomonadota bacterium]